MRGINERKFHMIRVIGYLKFYVSVMKKQFLKVFPSMNSLDSWHDNRCNFLEMPSLSWSFLFLNLGHHGTTLRFTEGGRGSWKDGPSSDIWIIVTPWSLPGYIKLSIILKEKKWVNTCARVHTYTHTQCFSFYKVETYIIAWTHDEI